MLEGGMSSKDLSNEEKLAFIQEGNRFKIKFGL